MKRTVKKKKVTLFHRIEPLLYLAPAFLVLGVFVYYPFFKAIGNAVKFAIFTVPFTVGLSFILAMMAAKKRPVSPIYETLFSLPMAMSTSVSAMIFELMFSPTLGIINSLTGLHIKWLSDKNTACPPSAACPRN